MDEMDAVMAAERAWTEAHLRGDVETLARLMAEDYCKIESDGSVSDRRRALASYTPGTRYWEQARGDEYMVRVYGDTALVIGRWTARGMNNGAPFDYTARFLSVYVKRAGEWKMVAEQSTEISIQEPVLKVT